MQQRPKRNSHCQETSATMERSGGTRVVAHSASAHEKPESGTGTAPIRGNVRWDPESDGRP